MHDRAKIRKGTPIISFFNESQQTAHEYLYTLKCPLPPPNPFSSLLILLPTSYNVPTSYTHRGTCTHIHTCVHTHSQAHLHVRIHCEKEHVIFSFSEIMWTCSIFHILPWLIFLQIIIFYQNSHKPISNIRSAHFIQYYIFWIRRMKATSVMKWNRRQRKVQVRKKLHGKHPRQTHTHTICYSKFSPRKTPPHLYVLVNKRWGGINELKIPVRVYVS